MNYPPPARMDLVARVGKRGDFASMYANCFGDAPRDATDATYRQVKHEWETFIHWPTAVTYVVEDRVRTEGDRVCGCGHMVFVTEDLAAWARRADAPGLNREAACPEKHYLLDRPQVQQANCSERGVTGLVTRWHAGTEKRMAESYRAAIRAVLYRSMMDFFLGYQFKEIIGEANGQQAMSYAAGAGFSVLNDFSEYYSVPRVSEPRFWLVHAENKEAKRNEPTLISQLFLNYRPPRLDLSPALQELLQLATLGYSDAEIAEIAGTSLNGVRKRWYALSGLERANPAVQRMVAESSPGSQGPPPEVNRNQWIQLARNNREELRPHPGKYYKKYIEPKMYAP